MVCCKLTLKLAGEIVVGKSVCTTVAGIGDGLNAQHRVVTVTGDITVFISVRKRKACVCVRGRVRDVMRQTTRWGMREMMFSRSSLRAWSFRCGNVQLGGTEGGSVVASDNRNDFQSPQKLKAPQK